MAGKRKPKKSQPKKPRVAPRPKCVVEAVYAWSEAHGYWKTLFAAVVLIFSFCIGSAVAKCIVP